MPIGQLAHYSSNQETRVLEFLNHALTSGKSRAGALMHEAQSSCHCNVSKGVRPKLLHLHCDFTLKLWQGHEAQPAQAVKKGSPPPP